MVNEIQLNSITYDELKVIDPADSSLVTGLGNGDFTKELYNPSGSEVSGSITVTVTELGNGKYRTSFTPNAEGAWSLTIIHSTYLPTGASNNYICMTRTSDIDNILEDTNDVQGKLPTNNIMGSSVKTDKDDEIDAILLDTGTTIPSQIINEHVTTDALVSSEALANRTHVTNEHTTTKSLISSEGAATRVWITTSEGNIRGLDDDTLKTISDQIDAVPDDSDISTITLELTKILGMLHCNFYVDQVNQVIDGLTVTETQRLRVYSVNTSVGTNNDVIHTVTIESKYGTVDKVLQYYKGVVG